LALNSKVLDDVLWVWWFDRQGAIQSEGVNMVQNLPYVLLLVLVMQRFTLEDWGINTKMFFEVKNVYYSDLDDRGQIPPQIPRHFKTSTQNKDFYFYPGSDQIIHHYYSLTGRGTSVYRCIQVDGCGEQTEVALKTSWSEVTRDTEDRIIAKAKELAGTDPDVEHHLPDVLGAVHFDAYNTRSIRDILDVDWGGRPETNGRSLLFLLLGLLRPLLSSPPEDVLRIWFEVVKCTSFFITFFFTHLHIYSTAGHYTLWNAGVEHTDPSLDNVMVTLDGRYGVLADWDLGVIRNNPKRGTTERMGTFPFMAVDLLTPEYWEGDLRRLYRHDLEGFVWILPWIALRYDNGAKKDQPRLVEWVSGDYDMCRLSKYAFLHEPKRRAREDKHVASCYLPLWKLTCILLQRISFEGLVREGSIPGISEKSSVAEDKDVVGGPEKFYGKFWGWIEQASLQPEGAPVLAGLSAYVPRRYTSQE